MCITRTLMLSALTAVSGHGPPGLTHYGVTFCLSMYHRMAEVAPELDPDLIWKRFCREGASEIAKAFFIHMPTPILGEPGRVDERTERFREGAQRRIRDEILSRDHGMQYLIQFGWLLQGAPRTYAEGERYLLEVAETFALRLRKQSQRTRGAKSGRRSLGPIPDEDAA